VAGDIRDLASPYLVQNHSPRRPSRSEHPVETQLAETRGAPARKTKETPEKPSHELKESRAPQTADVF